MSRLSLRLAAALLALIALTPVARAWTRFEKATTPAGIAFWHAPMPKALTVAVSAAWRDGLGLTLPGKEAISPVSAQWMARGDRSRTSSEIAELMKDYLASGGLSSSATLARTQLGIDAPPDKLMRAADLFAAALADPRFSESDLQRIRRDYAVANRNAEASGDGLAARVATRLIFGAGPSDRLFDPGAAEAIVRADAEAWRRAVLARDSLVVSVAGPIGVNEAADVIDRLFAALPATSGAPPRRDPPVRIPARTVVVEKAEAQTQLFVVADSDVGYDRERPAADLARRALGVGGDARLGTALRKGLGATYGVGASFISLGPNRQALAMQTAVAHDKAKAALAALKQEYRRWRSEGVTQAELDANRSALVAALATAFARPGALAGQMTEFALRGEDAAFFAAMESAIPALAVEDVNAVVRRRFGEALLVVIVAPSAAGYDADCVVKTSAEALACR